MAYIIAKDPVPFWIFSIESFLNVVGIGFIILSYKKIEAIQVAAFCTQLGLFVSFFKR